MKKFVLTFFSCLLALILLLGSFGSAKAEVGDDPVVTPVTGDMEFTTEVIPIASLPGTIELADLMLAPAGFPAGEAQFEGAGVLVTKFDVGKANACFTISGTQWGWGGKVGMWDGANWALLPTTITTTGDDGTSTTACATIIGNGTFAFIKYVVDPSLLPTLPECPFYVLPNFYSYSEWNLPGEYILDVNFEFLPLGTPVLYHITSYAQDGSIYGQLSGSSSVGWSGYWVEFPYLYSFIGNDFEYARMYLQFPTCYINLEWNQSTPAYSYGGSPFDGYPE